MTMGHHRTLLAMLTVSITLTSGACGPHDGWLLEPLSGPAFDNGVATEALPEQDTYVVSTTYLKVQDDQQELFQQHMDAINASLADEPVGLLGRSLGSKLGTTEVRTLSVWTSEQAIYDWAFTGAHMEAVSAASDIGVADVGKVLHWEVTADELPPTWEDAMQRVDTDGRLAY